MWRRSLVLMTLGIMGPALFSFGLDKRKVVGPVIMTDQENLVPPSVLSEERRVVPSSGPGVQIGATTFDWWENGPMRQMIVYSPMDRGIHALWMRSLQPTPNNDRHMTYNAWDPNYLGGDWVHGTGNTGGVDVQAAYKDGYGVLDVNSSNIAFSSMHRNPTSWIRTVCYDLIPYLGAFSCVDIPAEGSGAVPVWPDMAIDGTDWVHVFAYPTDPPGDDRLYYSRSTDGGSSYTNELTMGTGLITFPSSNIQASKFSSKVAATWSNETTRILYLNESTDGGTTWGGVTDISSSIPTTIATPTVWILGGYAYYDPSDNLHVVTQISEDGLIIPAEIWHYSPANTPNWSMIRRSNPDTIGGGAGVNMLMVARPSIGGSTTSGELIAVWEELDSLDVDPTLGIMNAEIWGARSCDNGQNWGDAVNLTNNPGITDRFPSIAAVNDDSVRIIYEEDLITGMYVHPSGSESPMSTNPVRVLTVFKDIFPCIVGVEEGPVGRDPRVTALFESHPNPFSHSTQIRYKIASPGRVVLKVYDISGRPVRTLLNGDEDPGVKVVTWNGRDDGWKEVRSGIYFYRLSTEGGFTATRKLTLIR